MDGFFKSCECDLVSLTYEILIHVHFDLIKQWTRLNAAFLSWIETIP